MLVGNRTNDPSQPVHLSSDGLLHHALVVGQSGSGKSFFVARLVEEIVLATRARVVIVDPNGDFRMISQVSQTVWSDLANRLTELETLAPGGSGFDTRGAFTSAWSSRRFLNLHPATAKLPPDTPMALHRRLVVHWDLLDDDDREFLLRGEFSTPPRTLLGLEACVEFARYLSERPHSLFGNDLRGLINAAEQFASRNVAMRLYPYAKELVPDDWYAVRAVLGELLQRHAVWWSRVDHAQNRPPGLSDFLDAPFETVAPESDLFWDVLTLSLDAAPEDDGLLVVNSALSRLWRNAKQAWRRVTRDQALGDDRVPTFIVVDEAQNFAPAQTRHPLRARVSDQLLQIAAEGRKYGLYLILATQRPTKLNPELVPECENSCLLRVQSRFDTEFASSALGIAPNLAVNAPSFRKGQGLISGRWIDNEVAIDARFGPARSEVGGGGLARIWLGERLPSPAHTARGVSVGVRDAIKAELVSSPRAIALVNLADSVRSQFPHIDSGNWQGAFSFKAFLSSLGIEGLGLSTAPPGYAFLRGVHPEPGDVPEDAPWLYGDVAAAGEREALLRLHRSIDLPTLESREFRAIYEVISEVVQEQPFNLTDTSKAARDRLAERGTPIRRIYIGYLLKGIGWAGHRFDSDLPQEPKALATAFCRQLARSVTRSAGGEEASFVGALVYCSGGLLAEEEVRILLRPIPSAIESPEFPTLTEAEEEATEIGGED